MMGMRFRRSRSGAGVQICKGRFWHNVILTSRQPFTSFFFPYAQSINAAQGTGESNRLAIAWLAPSRRPSGWVVNAPTCTSLAPLHLVQLSLLTTHTRHRSASPMPQTITKSALTTLIGRAFYDSTPRMRRNVWQSTA